LTTAETEVVQKLPQTKESLLKSHMNENASDYVKIKDSLIEKDSNKKIIREVIKKKSSLIPAAPSI
jgi:hypothetical protein